MLCWFVKQNMHTSTMSLNLWLVALATNYNKLFSFILHMEIEAHLSETQGGQGGFLVSPNQKEKVSSPPLTWWRVQDI